MHAYTNHDPGLFVYERLTPGRRSTKGGSQGKGWAIPIKSVRTNLNAFPPALNGRKILRHIQTMYCGPEVEVGQGVPIDGMVGGEE
jgi:hypothetical protein